MKMFTAFRAVGLAGLIVTMSGFRLFGQDVTVTDLAWFEPEKPGAEVLPQFKKKPSPEYPGDLKKEQPGYVISVRFIAEDGSVVRARERDWASHPYFTGEGGWEKGAKFVAATAGGKP